jgi:hypothetical protein
MFQNHFRKHTKRGGESSNKDRSFAAKHQRTVKNGDSVRRNNDVSSGDGGESSSKRRRKLTEKEVRVTVTQENETEERRRDQKKQGTRSGLSERALELSAQLKSLSREKKWEEAIQLYQNASNHKVRDSHHACIMVDMAARCGKITVRA